MNPTPLAQREFERILLVKPSSLGDIVHALPVLHGLRVRYPGAKISWLVAKDFRDLIEGNREFDEVIDFDRRRFAAVGRSLTATAGFVAFLRDLRRRRFDLVIDLQGLFRSGFMTWATGAKVRIGFSAAREFAPFFYTHRIPWSHPDTHAALVNYRVGSVLGFDQLPMRFDLAVTDEERRRADAILHAAFGGRVRRFVALVPGARWETKRWSAERFAQLARAIAGFGTHDVVLLGGASEASLCQEIQDRSGRITVNLAGKTLLRELVAVLERASVVVCHDSAPMHLAAALGRPLVCIFGPTNPKRTGPFPPTAHLLQADLPCVPCYLRNLSQCPYDHRCMSEIDVDQVLQQVKALLS